MAHPLPPHKFSPHDVVDVRPNKSDSNGPALVGGLVYRVKEDCITVAVEEAPDEGLDQPLRLEKLANEVRVCAFCLCLLSVTLLAPSPMPLCTPVRKACRWRAFLLYTVLLVGQHIQGSMLLVTWTLSWVTCKVQQQAHLMERVMTVCALCPTQL